MSRWRKAVTAAAVGMAASGGLVVTSSIPGQAETSLVANYHCTNGIAGDGVDIEARMTPQLTSGVLTVKWDMSYAGEARFGSPGYFAAGSRLSMEGVVDIDGAWEGQIRPKGGKDQDQLVPGSFLELPEGLSHGAAVTEAGKVRLKPAALAVRFTPVAGEWMVNNKNVVEYSAGWAWQYTDEQYGDHLNDVQETSTKDAVAKLTFKGTKVAYIGRRAPGLGPVRVLLNGKEVTKPLVQPGIDPDTKLPMTATKTKEVLWESDDLEYKQHTIEIVNVEAAPAYVDAFKVTIGDIAEPPVHEQATCDLVGNPGAIDFTIPGATTTPTDDPTDTNSPDPSDTGDPTDDPTDPNPPNPQDPDDDSHAIGGDRVIVVPYASTSTSASSTPKSTGPTATRYYRAQVANTPSGGVETGVAPGEEQAPVGLMAGGMALVMGSAGGGLLLRRRRAAHAGGAQ